MSTEAEAGMARVEAQWNEAGATWDPAKFQAMFTDDALFYGAHVKLFVGPETKDYFVGYVGQIVSARAKFVEQRYIPCGPGQYYAQGYADMVTDLIGRGEFKLRMRTTLLIAKVGEDWRVRGHHLSPMPAGTPLD